MEQGLQQYQELVNDRWEIFKEGSLYHNPLVSGSLRIIEEYEGINPESLEKVIAPGVRKPPIPLAYRGAESFNPTVVVGRGESFSEILMMHSELESAPYDMNSIGITLPNGETDEGLWEIYEDLFLLSDPHNYPLAGISDNEGSRLFRFLDTARGYSIKFASEKFKSRTKAVDHALEAIVRKIMRSN